MWSEKNEDEKCIKIKKFGNNELYRLHNAEKEDLFKMTKSAKK